MFRLVGITSFGSVHSPQHNFNTEEEAEEHAHIVVQHIFDECKIVTGQKPSYIKMFVLPKDEALNMYRQEELRLKHTGGVEHVRSKRMS